MFDRNKTEHKHASSPIIERIYRLIGVAGVRDCEGRPGLFEVTKDLFSVIIRPYLLLPTLGFTTWLTMWTIGLVSTAPQFLAPPPIAGGYGFNNTAVALMHLAPMIGTVLAEVTGILGSVFNIGISMPSAGLCVAIEPSSLVNRISDGDDREHVPGGSVGQRSYVQHGDSSLIRCIT